MLSLESSLLSELDDTLSSAPFKSRATVLLLSRLVAFGMHLKPACEIVVRTCQGQVIDFIFLRYNASSRVMVSITGMVSSSRIAPPSTHDIPDYVPEIPKLYHYVPPTDMGHRYWEKSGLWSSWAVAMSSPTHFLETGWEQLDVCLVNIVVSHLLHADDALWRVLDWLIWEQWSV